MTVPINIAALTLETPVSPSSTSNSGSRSGRVAEGFTAPIQNQGSKGSENQHAEEKFDSMLRNHIEKKTSGAPEKSNRPSSETELDTVENEAIQTSQARTNQQPPEEVQLRPGLLARNQGAADEAVANNESEFDANLKPDTRRRTISVAVASINQSVSEAQKGDSQTGRDPLQKVVADAEVSKNFTDNISQRPAENSNKTVDPPKPVIAPSSAIVQGNGEKPVSTNGSGSPESLELPTTSTPSKFRLGGADTSGNALPASGKPLPAATPQSISQTTVELVPELEQALIRPKFDALARTAGSASAQRLSAEMAPGLPLDKSLLNTDLEPLLRGIDADAARSLVPTATTHPGIGKSLLNTRIETKTRRIGLGTPQAIAKSALASPGLEKILANSAIPASELFSNALSQISASSASIDSASSSQTSTADSQSSTLLSVLQTNSKQAGDAKSSLTLGLKADAPMPSNLAPGSREWSNEIGSRIRWMSNLNISSAKLSLHPAELGSLEILIASEDNQTRVNFITSNAAAKEVIESSLPRLRELLNESGLQLEQGDVTHQDFNRNKQPEQLPIHENTLAKENVNTDLPQHSVPGYRNPTSNWQVDHYA